MNTLGLVTISLNQARYLEQAIDSVQLSAPSRLRYVAVDPGSTDGSRNILLRRQDRFDTLIFEPDSGPADGLNKGFARAGGDILGYLSSDDAYLPGALDFVMDYFERNPEIDVLLGAIRIIDQTGKASLRKRTPDKFNLRKFVHKACFFWQQGTFFRRAAFERVGGYNTANRISWDGELVFDMALGGARIGYTNRLLGDFRIYPESITGSARLLQENERALERMRAKAVSQGHPLYSPAQAAWQRLKYKYNPSRHLGYVLR